MKILDVFKSKSTEEENELDKALWPASSHLGKARDAAQQTLDAAKAATVRGTAEERCQ